MAPSLVATYTAELSAAGTLQTPAFTPAEGETLVVKAVGSHSAVVLAAPTGGGLTFAPRGSVTTASYATARLDTAVVPAAQASMAVSVSVSFTTGTGWQSSLVVERWTGAKLATTPATNATKTGTTAQAFSTSLTTAAASSVVTWVGGDWTPVATGTPAYLAGAASNYARRTTAVNVWSAWQTAGAAGAQSFGMTAPTGQKWSALGVELQASTRAEDVTDTFDGTTPAAQWTTVNGSGDQGGAAYVNASVAGGNPVYSSRRNDRVLTLFGSGFSWEVVAYPAGGTAFAQQWIRAVTSTGTLQGRLGFEYRSAAGALDMVGQTDTYAGIGPTTTITFDPVAHRYLRLRHDGTSILWETSPDRTTWTTRRTLAATAAPGWVTSSVLQFSFEAYRTAGTNDAFRFDNLNVAAPSNPPRSLGIGEPLEADSAQPLARARTRAIGQAVETSSASALAGRAHGRTVGQAVELDPGLPVSARRPGEARQARETDSALPVARTHARSVSEAGEADSAAPVSRSRRRTLGQAVDTSSASSLARSKRRPVGQALETEAASPMGRRHTITLGQALETETARAIAGRLHRRTLGQATETDTGRPVTRRHRRDVGQALAYDVAFQLAQSAGIVTAEAFAAAVVDPERTPFATLHVDWDADNYGAPDSDLSDVLRSVEIERATDGDLPEGAGLIDGYATATLKAELGGTRAGATMPLAAELSPFRPDSPRYGKRKTTRTVAGEIGLVTEDGPKAYRLFTGPLTDVGLDEGPRAVTLDAADPSERMRALATLPTYGEFVTHANRRPWKLTVNSQAVVDYCLRRNGINASPPARPEAIIVCTGHGSLFAERGFNGAPISIYGSGPASGLWTEDSHPYGMLGTPESPSYGTVGYQEFYGITDGDTPPVKFQSGYGVGWSTLLHVGSYMTGGSSVENRVLQLRPTEQEYPRLFVNVYGNGDLYAGLATSASSIVSTPRIPTGAGRWRFVGFHFQWTSDTTLVVRVRMDGQTRTYTLTTPKVTVTPTAFFAGYRPALQANGQLSRAWSNFQVWPSYAPPAAGEWQGESWVSQADVGRGNNELVYLPDVAAADSWDVLKAVTQAEYAVHGFTEFGRYYWRPRTDVRPDRVDHVLDVDTNLAEVAYGYSSDTLRNSVGATISASYHSGDLKTVVEAKDVEQFVCPAGQTKIYELDWPHGAAGYQGGTLIYYPQKDSVPTNGIGFPADSKRWDSDIVHGWTYSSIGASGGYTINDNTRSVVVRYCQISARRVQIRVTNPGPGPIRLATSAPADASSEGEPGLRIGGWPLEKVVDRVTTWANEESILELGGRDGGGERSLPIPSSEWRQSEAALEPVANDLLEALADETPVLEDLPVRGDPRIRVGNVAACRFLNGDVTVTGTVVKTKHTLDASDGRYQTLVSVRPLPVSRLAPPGVEFYVDIYHLQAEVAVPLDLGRLKVLGYAGVVAKIGQGAGTKANGDTLGAIVDPLWTTWRDQGLALWPTTTAGYWYVGNTEAPADQAARCLAAIGDPAIPVMLDWEDGSGSFANLLAVLDAFRAAGLLVTMVYAGRGYASANAPAGSTLAGRGVSLVSARYWSDIAGAFPDPRADWDDQRAGFGFEAFLGLTPRANQFTQYGTPYSGSPYTDVDAFLGTPAQLAAMFHGES